MCRFWLSVYRGTSYCWISVGGGGLPGLLTRCSRGGCIRLGCIAPGVDYRGWGQDTAISLQVLNTLFATSWVMAAAVCAFADHGFASFDIILALVRNMFPRGGLRLTLKLLMSVFLAFSTPFGFGVHFSGFKVLILDDHGINVGRTMDNGRPGFVIRGIHNTAFGYPVIPCKIERS